MVTSAPFEQFAAALREAMDARGIKTQAALAEELGFKQQAVSKWLHGLARPSLDVVTALEDFLKLDRGTLGITLGYAYPIVTEAPVVSASSRVPDPTAITSSGTVAPSGEPTMKVIRGRESNLAFLDGATSHMTDEQLARLRGYAESLLDERT